MSKRKSTDTAKLPRHVYRRKDRNCYIYKPSIGNGKQAKPVRLCSLDAPISEVWEAYESLNQSTDDTLRWLLDTYNTSETNKENTLGTQQQHEMYRNRLVSITGARGTQFGDLPLKSINRRMIRKYLDIAEHKVGANRQIQYMKAAWNWGSQRYKQVPEANPCAGVKLNKETARTRYVEDWEYQLVQDIILKTTRSPYLAVMMEIAYLCRARCSEVRNLKESDIQGDTLRLVRGKGSTGELTRISPRLREALDQASTLYPDARIPSNGTYLLHNKDGTMISKNKFDSAWSRVMDKAMNSGLTERFTFHDLKAKGVSDHTEQESGHKSDKAKKVYIRRLLEVDSTA